MATKKLFTPKCRLAFAAISRPKLNQRGEERWGAALLFTPSQFTPTERELWSALEEEAKARAAELPKGTKGRLPFRDGADKLKDDGTPWDGFGPGVRYFNVSTKRGPHDPEFPLTLVDSDGEVLEPEAFYSGCWVRAKVNAFTYQEGGNKGVSFGLLALQWLGEGERFGGGQGFEGAPAVEGAQKAPRRAQRAVEQASDEGGSALDDRPPDRDDAAAGYPDDADTPF